ncbi:MAG: hypothetical protein ACFNPX_08180, partial [Neisseria subflava]
MFSKSVTLAQYDPDLAAAIAQEDKRQQDHVELIASENYVSCAVMEAQGSQLTNKYAEGYPGKRYYGGCEYVDIVEQLAIDRVKELFGAAYANVQPHSGSQANQAVYASVLKPGDIDNRVLERMRLLLLQTDNYAYLLTNAVARLADTRRLAARA